MLALIGVIVPGGGRMALELVLLGCNYLGIGALGIWFARLLFRTAEKIKPVTLITRHNTAGLPAVETLVRPFRIPALSAAVRVASSSTGRQRNSGGRDVEGDQHRRKERSTGRAPQFGGEGDKFIVIEGPQGEQNWVAWGGLERD